MGGILTLQDNVDLVYTEATKGIARYTPVLYMPSTKRSDSVDAVGSSILFKRGGQYYLITAGHCLKQEGTVIKVGVMDKRDFHELKGKAIICRGEEEKVDIGIIRLDEVSKEVCSRNYAFLDDTQIMNNRWIPDETEYLVAGYPLTKVSIDHKRKRVEIGLMPYLSKSRPAALYKKMGYPSHQNLLLAYDRRRSGFVGGSEMNMSPYPKGLSGCGIWYISDYFIEDIQKVKFNLAAIMIEYHASLRTIVATKFEMAQVLFLIL